MDVSVTPVSIEQPCTLYRLQLFPSGSQLEGELYYEDDKARFREKGLDIQDFAPSFLDIHQYALQENSGSPLYDEQVKAPQLQVFIYSFSYLPDPTWLVNWEHGENMDDWFEKETVRINGKTKRLELDLGEYITGAVLEVVKHHPEDVKGLRIVSFRTNQKREVVITKSASAKTGERYKIVFPEGYGIIGRFPSPLYTFGFYVGWMIPRTWSIQTHLWFPVNFRQRVKSLILCFYRASKESQAATTHLPFGVVERILRCLSSLEPIKPETKLEDLHWKLIEEI